MLQFLAINPLIMSTIIDDDRDSGLHEVRDLLTGEAVPPDKLALAEKIDRSEGIDMDTLKAVRQTQLGIIERIYRVLLEKYSIDEQSIADLPEDITKAPDSLHALLRIMRFLLKSRDFLTTSELAEDACDTAERMLNKWPEVHYADMARNLDDSHDPAKPIPPLYSLGVFQDPAKIHRFIQAQVTLLKTDDGGLLRINGEDEGPLHS